MAQLGARLNGIQKVSGSIPLGSTKRKARLVRAFSFLYFSLGGPFSSVCHYGVTTGSIQPTNDHREQVAQLGGCLYSLLVVQVDIRFEGEGHVRVPQAVTHGFGRHALPDHQRGRCTA